MAMKALTISVIVMVAVIMGFSTIAPALQQAFAHDVTEQKGARGNNICPRGFGLEDIAQGDHPDHNFNGKVCEKLRASYTIVIDDLRSPPPTL